MSSQTNESKKHNPYAALKFPEFRFFILARFLATIGIQMQAVIIGWQIYEITKDPFSLGLIGLAEAIPALSIALYAGHIADKFNRRRIILSCLAIILFCSLCFLFLNLELIHIIPNSKVNIMYAIIFLTGLARGFIAPAMFAFMSQLVPKEIYPNSSTWSSTSWQIAAIIGPAIGGLVYGFYGGIFTFCSIIILLTLSLVSMSTIKNKPFDVSTKKERIYDRLKEGIHFVFKSKVILGALSLDLFAVLFGGAVALLPVFAKEILMVGPEGLGLLRAAPSFGAVITMIFLAYNPPVKTPGKTLLLSVAAFGLCMISFALSTNFILSLILLSLSGAFDSVSVIIRSTILQLLTPENMRGRVSAVNTMFIGSSNEIGAFESGMVAKLMGTVPSVIFGGCMTLLVVSITNWKAKTLRVFSLKEIK